MYQDRISFPPGINQYVKGMQYAASLVSSAPTEFSLGTPAVASSNAVVNAGAANAIANTIVAAPFTMDSPYGRSTNFIISGNPGNTNVVDIYGFDYLGQPMIERFSGASGVTAILYGKKAFKRVISYKIITPSTNAVTFNLATGNRLGLPYKGDLAYAKESGIQIPIWKRDTRFEVSRPAALAIAGGSVFIASPFPGFIKTLYGFSYGAGSTNDPVIVVKLATVAITGLTITINADLATTAAVAAGAPTTPGYSANNRVAAGDVVEVSGTAAASAGGDTLGLILTPIHFALPDLTDAATANTGDPRGTYEAINGMNGVAEIRVGLIGDNQINAAGNGGLHGIKHFFA